MIESVPGIISAAPTPWSGAAGDEPASSGARPIARSRRAKTTTPNRNIRRRPKMSPSRPPVTSSTAKVERVGVDRPLEGGQRGVEVALDRRQRDVHDRVVEHDHEQREAHRGERPPAAVLLGEAEPFGHGGEILSTMGRRASRSAACSSSESDSAQRSSALVRARVNSSSSSRPAGSRATRRERRSAPDSVRPTRPRWTSRSTARDAAGSDRLSRAPSSLTARPS